MQITKELIENDIRSLEVQRDNLKSSLDRSEGALATLKNILMFLDAPEPTPPVEGISDVNKAVQDELQAYMTEKELAEAVGGPGAVVEAIEELPADPVADKIVDGSGKYVEKEASNG